MASSISPKKQLKRLERVISKVNRIQKAVDSSSERHKLNTISLNLLSNQLQSTFSPKSSRHLPKPKKPLISMKSLKKGGLEAAKLTLSPTAPQSSLFITENLMQTKSMAFLLNQSKRHFGFTLSAPKPPDSYSRPYQIYPNALNTPNVKKRLNAILYNNTYRNSQRSKRDHILKRYNSLSPQQKSKDSQSRSSPLLKFLETNKEKYSDEDISSRFKEVVAKAEHENGVMKLKLGRFLYLKDAFVGN